MDEQSAAVDAIAERIRRYLHDHPNAADTVEGVALWWLSGNSSAEWLRLVHSAIDMLVAMDVVERKKLPDGTVIVGRSKRALER